MIFNLLLPHNLRFKRWIELEDKKEQILRASEQNSDEFTKLLLSFLSDALSLPLWFFNRLYWVDTLVLFAEVSKSLLIEKYLPLIYVTPDKKSQQSEMWDYKDRTWQYYSHILSKNYGWSLEYIGELSVFDALAHVQEILLSEQLDREFQWSMSEASVIYDAKTKTTKPNPLPRPYWMKQTDKLPSIPKFKLPKSVVPVGNVNNDGVPDDYKPKEVINK